jgi:hypothetical protein
MALTLPRYANSMSEQRTSYGDVPHENVKIIRMWNVQVRKPCRNAKNYAIHR